MKKWAVNKPDKKIVSDLTLKCGVSTLTAAVLAARGYTKPDEVMNRLNVNELSDPFLIKDMQTAADTINQAIDNGNRICVYGDYDCDGVMSTVMLYSYLTEVGADVIYYIPERSEGYGMNSNAIVKLAESDVELIITVDNGISAINESELIYKHNMKLVITDHHQPGDCLPHAEAVVDPHRNDCFSPFKYLCGAGIVLKLIAALDGGDYTMALEQFGDLAAIATIADIVSLTGENRFIASYGMHLIENTDRTALVSLKEVCGLKDKKINSTSVGFGLAPRINAAGRFGSPQNAVNLFLSEDETEITEYANQLNALNNERKSAEKDILNEIYKLIDSNPILIHERVIFLIGKNWHHGVIGIIAARIMERFGKPCFIASETDGEIRGSARAFGDFSVFKALSYCSDVLEKFGGHYGAGGFTVKNGMQNEFNNLLQKYALEQHKLMPVYTICADAAVSPAELNVKDVSSLLQLEPFGTENEKPHFFIENAKILEIIPMSGGVHTKLKLKFGYTEIYALLFRTASTEVGIDNGSICDFIVTLDINNFKGKQSISIIIKDYRNHIVEQSKVFAAQFAYESFLRNEKLPDNYYKSMYPIRDDVVYIYTRIPTDGINFDKLFFNLCNPSINYCKYSVSIEALRQLKLISFNNSDGTICRLKAEKKVDLHSAPILIDLKKMIV